MNQAALAKQMDALQLLPRPQHFTELYFTDAQKLPATYKSGSAQQLQFITHNLEHQPTTYHYQIMAVAAGSTTGEPLADGAFTLEPDEYRTTTQTITIPAPSAHTAITVVLGHKDISQSLHFWVSITKPEATNAAP
jgi:hypothetical protein